MFVLNRPFALNFEPTDTWSCVKYNASVTQVSHLIHFPSLVAHSHFDFLQGALNLQDTVLEGDKKVNAQFGAAIASVGDLNADGFQGMFSA